MLPAVPAASTAHPAPLTHPLFLYSSPPPPDLHSFPTRRSSDLIAPTQSGPDLTSTVSGTDGTLRQTLTFAYSIQDFTIRDRKSTRLNSSHRCISYAVFCLKKKKKNY